MALSLGNIVVDSADAGALAGFYAKLLHQPVDPDANGYFATVGRGSGMSPLLMFIKVPDKTPGKNVVHLDFRADDRRAEVERAVALGARHIADFAEYGMNWTTLADPEGNLFDIGGE
ncbi:VOC family protein [Nocardia donostiensis]|uniref:Glyoxalase/bleomycin resistance/dioxygenase family protein n=1 Tax=Nocardia donostiensis TaxID=1538463 RepID=A0A1W0AVQ2_9NOCA|nr:VOC family protein [Nocardia donostiensis]ONM47465.1 glyoxalase/bleomycin resistance/dioxygenase family protein [Nocardia donostiensis]OQS14305.1 glyoxalase/bleomycin resistance/dioxygenase family protein [Nocardia donostiensis]OQS17866.1 glyoxalase/bleomycin resistance/dioxygenase family protein [Nocardia donostiensis]